MAEELRMPGGNNANPGQPQPQVQTDASGISTVYTNFCQARGTPEELVLDFGLNPSLMPVPAEPIKLSHRVVMNYYTAKRMLSLLTAVIQQHESQFGPLELDFQKRIINRPPGVK